MHTIRRLSHDFLHEYKIRSSLERLIYHYANKPLQRLSIPLLYEQSRKLDKTSILQIARDTVEGLLAYNARRLRTFRNLPYLVMLNPSISELYSIYLKTMLVLLNALVSPPKTLAENETFTEEVLRNFIDMHADTLPLLSKGFSEVVALVPAECVDQFLNEHLRERISMRLMAHQHVMLTESLMSASYEKGGLYNGVIQQLDMRAVIKNNQDHVNDICLLKYDQTVPVHVNTSMQPGSGPASGPIVFPYIEYHLDYILTELFKNSFRAHIENKVAEPVQVTVATSASPLFMELRIRDRGKGIEPRTLKHMFDYSFSTYESGEGDSYKTLNAPPGLGGNVVAGMGYGLPLSKNYVEVFGGLLSVQSYHGWGTDVYLKTGPQ